MRPLKLILLPGLDGTGKMFHPLLPYLSSHLVAEVISYPVVGMQSYSTLVPYVEERLPNEDNFVLLGESFSGPLAVEIAASAPKNLKGVVLCASFLSSPIFVPPIFRTLVASFASKLPHWAIFLRYFLLSSNFKPEILILLKNSLSEVSHLTLASRLRAIFDCDVTASMSQITLPILYLYPAQDRLVPNSVPKFIKSFKVKATSIPAPHCLLQIEPEKSAKLINEFCDTLY